MIIFPEQYVPLYEAVKADAYQSDDRKVIVFVSASEADSVAAVRILQVRRRKKERGRMFGEFLFQNLGRRCLSLYLDSNGEVTLGAWEQRDGGKEQGWGCNWAKRLSFFLRLDSLSPATISKKTTLALDLLDLDLPPSQPQPPPLN